MSNYKYKPLPNYSTHVSVWPAILSWTTLFALVFLGLAAAAFFVLDLGWVVAAAAGAVGVIFLLITIGRAITNRFHTFNFYNNYVIESRGVFNKRSSKTIFPRITSVQIRSTFAGLIFRYGSVNICVAGPQNWDVFVTNVARPKKLRDFLNYYMLTDQTVEDIARNPYIAAGVFNTPEGSRGNRSARDANINRNFGRR